jgi:UDP-glucuronate 4-epimerase
MPCPLKVDAVVHLAAIAGIRPANQVATTQYDTNVIQTVRLLDKCVENGVRQFVYISSSSVYGNNAKVPFSENDNTDKPLCHYAATKKAGELVCYTYHHLHGIDVACLRPFTVYGPGQTTEMAIPLFTKRIHQQKAITLYGNGERDYVYVDDMVDAIVRVLDRIHGYEIYNIGTSVPISLLTLVGIIERTLNKKSSIMTYEQAHKGEAKRTYADISKAERMLGYKPKVGIYEGIDRFVKWYLEVNE